MPYSILPLPLFNKSVLLFSGFTQGPPEKDFRNLLKQLSSLPANLEAITIDYLKKEGKRSFLVTRKTAIDAKERTIEIIRKENIKPEEMITWSYGIIPAILASTYMPGLKKIIMVSPVFGQGSIKWKWYEKILLLLPKIFPGFREMESERFWQGIYSRLRILKEKGLKLVFLIPPGHQDGRIKYSSEAIAEMKRTGQVIELPKPGHRAAVNDEENIKKISNILYSD